MCGIIGLADIPDLGVPFRTLVEKLSHRGPDAGGEFENRFGDHIVKLGHRRLSIIDLSDEANQPFEKDDFVLVFNGEIYNFRTLKAALEQAGARFRTNSDTEVVLEAWRAWGPDSLRRLRGMFAFALYRPSTGELFLARDPFGVKPLFVLRKGSGLAFASELKALIPVMGSQARIDDTGILASLIYGWVPDEFSVYENVSKLPGGSWLRRTPDGRITESVYWDPTVELAEQMPGPLDIPALRHVLEDSIKAHMVADVPVATFLSGGLDSSLVTVVARKEVDRLDSFTIGFHPDDQKFESMPDDLKYARQLAAIAKVDLHEIVIRPDIADILPKIVEYLDEPIGDSAAINTYLICKAAREIGIHVLLSGMGADEVFGGYRRHYACLLASRYRRTPDFLRGGLVEPMVGALPAAGRNRGYRPFRWAKRFVQFASLPEEQSFQRSFAYLDRNNVMQATDPGLVDRAGEVFASHDAIYAKGSVTDQVNRMCYADVRLFLRGLNLAYTDRASMAASCEVRVPFVDVEVVRAAFAIAGSDKIRGRTSKYALKKAAEAWLPKEIIYRPKALFSAPLRSWVRNDLREMVDDVLPSGELVRRGYLKSSYVRMLIDDDRRGREDNSKQIWHLLSMDEWLRTHRTETGEPQVAAGGRQRVRADV